MMRAESRPGELLDSGREAEDSELGRETPSYQPAIRYSLL